MPLEDPADLGWNNGFEALYWFAPNRECKAGCANGKPSWVTTNNKINFTNRGEFQAQKRNFPPEFFAAEWYGKIAIKEGGDYEFSTRSDDGSRLSINGKLVVDNWGLHGMVTKTGTIGLNKGYHDIKMEFF